MPRKHNEAEVPEAEITAEAVPTEVETSVAKDDVTVDQPVVETAEEQILDDDPKISDDDPEIIAAVAAVQAVIEESVVIPEPEVTAEEIHVEEPKVVVTAPVITPQGTVVETRYSTLPAPARRYRLVNDPMQYPRGRQRAITYELLKKYAPKDSDKDMSAEEVYKEADATVAPLRFATAKTVDSIAWHLNQMLIRGEVICTSGRVAQTVERKVTPAEALATAPAKPMSLEDAISKGLIVLTPDQIAAMQLVK